MIEEYQQGTSKSLYDCPPIGVVGWRTGGFKFIHKGEVGPFTSRAT